MPAQMSGGEYEAAEKRQGEERKKKKTRKTRVVKYCYGRRGERGETKITMRNVGGTKRFFFSLWRRHLEPTDPDSVPRREVRVRRGGQKESKEAKLGPRQATQRNRNALPQC